MWPSRRELAAAFLGVALAVAAPAHADVRLDERDQRSLDRLVGFLQDTQNEDGGYGGQPGADSDPVFSAWVGIGLAAAGINPQDQRAPHGRSLTAYVARAGPATDADGSIVTTEYERIGLLVNAAGLDPRRFGGRDYVTPLVARQHADGWFPHAPGGTVPGVNDTIFAIVFLVGVEDPSLAPVIARAAEAVETFQRADGTWPATRPGGPTDVDVTGAAIQALCAAGRCSSPRVASAFAWLREQQRPDGGWSSGWGLPESNAGTTPWVVQALWAAGIDPRTWAPADRDPLDFLRSMQRRDGSVRWKATQDMNPTWMTAYAAPAYAGHAWPVPAPPRATPPRSEQGAQTPARRRRDDRTSGRGGIVEEGDGSVVAGGGGRGAPLFSRPQPQSRGATQGGVRDTAVEQQPLPSTRGDDGATGTAAASGAGGDGGVENGEPARPTAATAGEIEGVVVAAARGTEGTGEIVAVAPGLRSASEGGSAWLGAAILGGALLAAAGGAARERRSLS